MPALHMQTLKGARKGNVLRVEQPLKSCPALRLSPFSDQEVNTKQATLNYYSQSGSALGGISSLSWQPWFRQGGPPEFALAQPHSPPNCRSTGAIARFGTPIVDRYWWLLALRAIQPTLHLLLSMLPLNPLC